MKRLLICVFFAITCVLGGLSACNDGSAQQSSHTESGDVSVFASAKIMSINIAGQDMTGSDNVGSVKYPGQTGHDYTYKKRRARLDALIGEYMPNVLFLQEVNGNKWWWPYLVSNGDSFLNTFTNYTLVGTTNRVGGTDGAGKYWYDLYNQLYFDNNKFDAVASGMFYLNVRRDEPFSDSWHESAFYSSDDNNTCVWAVLKDKKTGVSALYASTHLKPAGSYLARKLTNYRQAVNLAEGLYDIAAQYADGGGTLPIVVGGDFNMHTATTYNYSYPHMTLSAHYSDAQKSADKTDNCGTARVWGKNKTATADDGSISDGYRIDMFFTQGMSVKKYQCLNGMFYNDADGVYYSDERLFDGSGYDLSDHLPIMINVEIPFENREVLAPEEPEYINTSFEADEAAAEGTSLVSGTKIVFTADDLAAYFLKGQYMRADAIFHPVYGGVVRLMATESCPNANTYFDYKGLLAAKGLTPANINNYSKIKITYKTSFTVKNGEFVLAVLNEGDKNVNYGINTVAMPESENFSEKVLDIQKSETASGKITNIMFGTMAYNNDYSGVCGLVKGDSVYIRSIEFIA